MSQYPIPQFIEEEGKIIFFLTFRQFFILVGAGAICFLFYFTLPFWLFAILSLFIGLLAGTIAFLKINNVSVVRVFLNFVGFLIGAKNYTWKKEESFYPSETQKNQISISQSGLGEINPPQPVTSPYGVQGRENYPQSGNSRPGAKKIQEFPVSRLQNSKLTGLKKIIETKR